MYASFHTRQDVDVWLMKATALWRIPTASKVLWRTMRTEQCMNFTSNWIIACVVSFGYDFSFIDTSQDTNLRVNIYFTGLTVSTYIITDCMRWVIIWQIYHPCCAACVVTLISVMIIISVISVVLTIVIVNESSFEQHGWWFIHFSNNMFAKKRLII